MAPEPTSLEGIDDRRNAESHRLRPFSQENVKWLLDNFNSVEYSPFYSSLQSSRKEVFTVSLPSLIHIGSDVLDKLFPMPVENDIQSSLRNLASSVTSHFLCHIIENVSHFQATGDEDGVRCCSQVNEVLLSCPHQEEADAPRSTDVDTQHQNNKDACDVKAGLGDANHAICMMDHITVEDNIKVEVEENVSVSTEESEELIKLGHKEVVTKDVPPEIVYRVRGTCCTICLDYFRGPKCLNKLIDHTKKAHRRIATPKFIRKLRRDNSAEKLIGDGIPYCTCAYCRVFGLAAHDPNLETLPLPEYLSCHP